MAKVIARKPGVHKSDSKSISFKKDPETGLFKKVEHDIRCYHLEHKSKKIGKPEISEEWYEIGDEDNWDYKFDVSAPNNKMVTLFFKKKE